VVAGTSGGAHREVAGGRNLAFALLLVPAIEVQKLHRRPQYGLVEVELSQCVEGVVQRYFKKWKSTVVLRPSKLFDSRQARLGRGMAGWLVEQDGKPSLGLLVHIVLCDLSLCKGRVNKDSGRRILCASTQHRRR
jgi:hypothetical protein